MERDNPSVAAPSINSSEPFERNEKRFFYVGREKTQVSVSICRLLAKLKYTRGNFCGSAEFRLKRIEMCATRALAAAHGRAL